MKPILSRFNLSISLFSLFIFFSNTSFAQSTLDCQKCHIPENTAWQRSVHDHTQTDVASELSANWAGQAPDSVISGSQAEDCVACHGPTAGALNGGMTETQVMGNFFTTTYGHYTDSTSATNVLKWPNVNCVTCHNVPSDHFVSMPTLSVFNSQTATYDSKQSPSVLCGQCHGSLHFPDTDHRIYDGWKMSKHGHGGQFNVAGELAANDTGRSPTDIVQDEDCIGCHAPTSVVIHTSTGPSLITEGQAMSKFYSTSGGNITSSTIAQDTTDWPDVSCIACHDPHTPSKLSYFNSSVGQYQLMSSPDSLCGQCHGNLRFPGTDHISYNFLLGEGGTGIQSQVSMNGQPTCIDCHMHKSDADGLNSTMYKGHGWQVFVKEPDGSTTASCTTCHTTMSADSAMAVVDSWQNQFTQLDSVAEADVALADTFVTNHPSDSMKVAYLAEASQNMVVAEDDESGGVHNHGYSVALLNDAIAKSQYIVTGVVQKPYGVPLNFALLQNYPNPFNPSTTIRFDLKVTSRVTLDIFNVLGQKLIERDYGNMNAGSYQRNLTMDQYASGVYFYMLRAVGINGELFQSTKKMLLMK